MFVTQMNRRVAASLGDSLFAKALSYVVSAVKVNHVQDRTATRRLHREVSVSVATNEPFWQMDSLLFCSTVRFWRNAE